MKKSIFIFLFFLTAAPLLLAEGKRPYEMDWANRFQDEVPALEDFESGEWTVETNGTIASFELTNEQKLWGEKVGKLTYRKDPDPEKKASEIIVRPSKPILLSGDFDAVSVWVYGNNWAWEKHPDTPSVTIHAMFSVPTANGEKTVLVRLGTVNWKEWFLLFRRLTPEQLADLQTPGAAFTGFRVEGCGNPQDRMICFDGFAIRKDVQKPLTFKPRPKRGVVIPQQIQGVNTGEGTLPFPTRPETILPLNKVGDFSNGMKTVSENKEYALTYTAVDGGLEFRLAFQPDQNPWSCVSASWNGSEPFFPLTNGGVTELANPTKPLAPAWKVTSWKLISQELKGKKLETVWLLTAQNPASTPGEGEPAETSAEVKYSFSIQGKSLIIETESGAGSDSPNVANVQYGVLKTHGLENVKVFKIPYYSYAYSGPNRPAAVCFRPTDNEQMKALRSTALSPLFLMGNTDWYLNNGSKIYGQTGLLKAEEIARYNGGVQYLPKTDGKRNPCYERFILTISPDFEEVLPYLPNPISPWKHIAGKKHWIVIYSNPPDRETNKKHCFDLWRHGIRELVINDHEVCFRDGGESFTFRTRSAPAKGGDPNLRAYSDYVNQELGFVYGPYNNFTDFAPVNEYWSTDTPSRTVENQFQGAWARCYAPKPTWAVEYCEKLSPINQEKFHFRTAYCDVHTAVSSSERTDYDARVPGAGTQAAVYYAFGEIMLLQKAAWNGPVYSEGNYHFPYCGLTDGNYAQDQGYRPAENPWIVNHDLRNMHDKCCNFGMGSPGMFYPQKSEPKHDTPETKDVPSDRFFCASMAFGHQGFLATQYGMRVAMRGYFNAQQLQSRYTQVSADQILYCAADGRLLCASAAIASGVSDRSQVVVKYADGTVICANGSMTERMLCDFDGRKVDLPPNGYTGWTADGTVYTFSGLRAGKRCDYAESPEYVFLDGRDFMQRFEKAIGAGCGLCRKVDEKHWEILTLDGAQMGFKLPPVAKVTALNHENQEIGPAEFDLVNGYIYVKPVDGAFSYLVELADDPAQTASEPLKCDRWEVLAGETVEIQTPDGPEKFTIPADAPLHQRVWFTHGPNRLEFCPRPLAQIFAKADSEKITFHVKPNFPQYSALTVELNGEKKMVDGEGDAVFPTVLPTSEDTQNATPETPLDGVLNVTVSNGTHTQKAEFKTRFFMDFERFDFPMESGMTFIQYPGKEPEAENTPETGATWIPQNGMVCGTVSKSGFFTHPPYKKGTGTIFRVWDVDLARDFAGPVFFDASVGKKNDSDLGDGILYQIYVQEQGSEPGEWEKLAEVHIPTHEWKSISADLGPWAGKKIRLRLETNPGKNTSGDWGVWADLTFRTTEMTPIFEIVD
ncbi:MAG: hypothetical protein IJU53_09270 [Thermoguttaceae bacterium]|nr:hypothetical protein [Thermoguttaceae bacterium]